MQTGIKNRPTSQSEILLQDSNSESVVYGLEFIANELGDRTHATKSQRNDKTTLDWFGLSDLCI